MPHVMRGFQARQSPNATAGPDASGPLSNSPDIIEGDFRVEENDRDPDNK